MADWRDELALLQEALKAQNLAQNNTLANLGDARPLNTPQMTPPQLPQVNLQELESPGRGVAAAGRMTLPMLGHNVFARGAYEAFPGAPANYRMMFGIGGQF